MRSDDILDQIDTALHDYTVSDDAMRSRPAAEGEQHVGPKIWIMSTVDDPDSGGWVALNDALDVTIDPATIDPAGIVHQPAVTWDNLRQWYAHMEAERVRRAREALAAIGRAMEAMRPAAQEAGRAMETLTQAVQRPSTPPGRRTDRPAWQSPYGPPRRR
ncbi:hypothetical protein [Streptomyces sp. SCL15-4]|uniref:hypothetical protein n=1 Tax=Streptomyces sp. SCL15-4 TaxID=2967221 RepID=UPI002966ACC8|nr:hypothetical protein [Streptomyces sp. SCL15-4]